MKSFSQQSAYGPQVDKEEDDDEEVVVVEEKTEGGIIMYSKQEDMTRDQFAQTIGTIVAVGSTAWKAYDRFNPVTGDELADWKPWAAVGDKVLFAKYAATAASIDDCGTALPYAPNVTLRIKESLIALATVGVMMSFPALGLSKIR